MMPIISHLFWLQLNQKIIVLPIRKFNINRPTVLTGGYETRGDAISGIIYIDSPMVFDGTENGNVTTTNTGNGTGVDFIVLKYQMELGNFGGAVSSTKHWVKIDSTPFVHSSNNINSFWWWYLFL